MNLFKNMNFCVKYHYFLQVVLHYYVFFLRDQNISLVLENTYTVTRRTQQLSIALYEQGFVLKVQLSLKNRSSSSVSPLACFIYLFTFLLKC